jgi:cell wall-associated NlpC family hydrolase
MDWWNKYAHIPFIEKGREAIGVDCWGLVRMIYKIELQTELPDYLDVYETTNDRDALAKVISQERETKWLNPETPKPFDIIILKMRGLPMHVGVVTKPGFMIHCARDIGTVHERYTGLRWKDKVIGYARKQ